MASWSSSSWEAYLKAADQQQLGSDVSTATGGSTPSSAAQLPLARGCRLNSDSALCDQKRSSLPRTPLSSKATPFFSSRPFGMYSGSTQHQQVAVGWMPVVVAVGEPQDYSEEAQEDVYLHQDKIVDYSETLQEDVYLGHAQHTPGQQQRGRLSVRDEKRALPSRTPSPAVPALISEAATAAANFLSILAGKMPEVERAQEADNFFVQQHPVKRTFIHYDQPTRFVKSASAPSILIQDIFRTKLTMPELHLRGECSPCAYFYHKEDGCRRGSDCMFCHTCPADEMKKRKKQKIKAMKARKKMLQDESLPHEQLADGDDSD